MIKLSTGLRVYMAITGSMRAALNNGLLRIYSGAVPAGPDAAIGGATLLCEVSKGGDGTPVTFEATAPLGVLRKSTSETWVGEVVAGGTPTFFRFVNDGDDGTASSSAVRLQGSAGALGSDLFIPELPLQVGDPQSFALFQLAIPEQ